MGGTIVDVVHDMYTVYPYVDIYTLVASTRSGIARTSPMYIYYHAIRSYS